MTLKAALGIACVALATSVAAFAQANDECAGAVNLVPGIVTPFDTTLATTSPELWNCTLGGADLWYRFTATTSDTYFVETCGPAHDTALTVFDGSCGVPG